MPEKILKTRILLRNDETANWLKNQNTVLGQGEAGVEFLANGKIKYFETNLNLEDNLAVRTQWNRFNSIENKKRRSFIKKL